MSDLLYSTRLRWSNGRGVARLHGVSTPLSAPPVIGGQPVHAIDYTPEVRCLQIQRRPCDRWEDMTAEEVAEADALLRSACGVHPLLTGSGATYGNPCG